MKKTDPPVVVTHMFPVDASILWAALTDAAQLRQWFFDNIPEFTAVVGFKTHFDVSTGERTFPHLWEVIAVEPNRLLTHRWEYGGYDGVCTIDFLLEPNHGKTRLTVTATVLEDFDDQIPEFKRESCVGGWQYFIQESLAKYLSR